MSKEPEPTEPLQVHVDWYGEQGYRVALQTKTYTKLQKKKTFLWRILARLWYFFTVAFHLLDSSSAEPEMYDALVLEIKEGKDGDVVEAIRDVVFQE